MDTKKLQRELNQFMRRFKLRHKWLKVDGDFGPATRERIKLVKYYLGYVGSPTSRVDNEFLWRLEHPRWGGKHGVTRKEWQRGASRRVARRKALRSPKWSWAWQGSRGVTNEVIGIVGRRAPITSRKRWATFGNRASDHYMLVVNADAVDFGIEDAHWLKNEIARKLTYGRITIVSDFEHFFIFRKGKKYRIQIIAATHGTGPHLHVGVRRA
jgi:hypothetical protein